MSCSKNEIHASKQEFSANQDFISSDPRRILRIMSEFVDSFDKMSDENHRLVAVFGSARTKTNATDYKQAAKLAKLLVENGYGVITGGGPGIMGAANKGAFEANGTSVGLNILLPMEQHPNKYQTRSLDFHYFFTRKVCFLKYATAVIAFPGGYGTFDEVFETLTMIQTKKIMRVPVILVGKKFWGGLLEWIKENAVGSGTLTPDDLELFKLVDTAEEAVDHLLYCHQFGIHGTVLPG